MVKYDWREDPAWDTVEQEMLEAFTVDPLDVGFIDPEEIGAESYAESLAWLVDHYSKVKFD